MSNAANRQPDGYVQIAVRKPEIPDLLNDLLPLDHDAFGATHDLVQALQAARSSEALGVAVQPRRGDTFEAWLKAQRDEYGVRSSPQWITLDGVLDAYRLHADTGTPIDQHICEGCMRGDCEYAERARTGPQ